MNVIAWLRFELASILLVYLENMNNLVKTKNNRYFEKISFLIFEQESNLF